MADLLARAVNVHLDVYTRSPEFKSFLFRLMKWSVQGYEKGFSVDDREMFTASAARRIRSKARSHRVIFLGLRLWRARYPMAWCEERAEQMVTDFLRGERIKFGDPRYCWNDGDAIADEEMSYWERIQ